jgi:hypothetical protein
MHHSLKKLKKNMNVQELARKLRSMFSRILMSKFISIAEVHVNSEF